MSELQRIKAFQASTRCHLDSKAIRWCSLNAVEFNTLRAAITAYLASLDPYSDEWSDWIEAYGESKLSRLFNVAL